MQWNKFDWNDQSTWPPVDDFENIGTIIWSIQSDGYLFGYLTTEGDYGINIEVNDFRYYPADTRGQQATHWMRITRPE